MSYFNHAFKKSFLGTSFQSTAGISSATISATTGKFGFVDPNSWQTVNQVLPTTVKSPLVLVAGSLRNVDQIGPFAGGYTESVKSKTINPKYVTNFYRVDPCDPQQMQITVGSNYNNQPFGEGSNSCNLNSGSVINREFLCNSTYNLRVDIKGSPVLRYLTRNTYYTAAAYTGCCAEGVDGIGAPVNPLLVYVQWAYQLLNSPLIAPFIKVQITYTLDYTNAPVPVWTELAGTDGTNSADTLEALLGYINNPSTLPAVVNYDTVVGSTTTPGLGRAGLIITGAYVDTEFGTCTFYPNDSIIAKLEPVKVYASEVDLNGDPCAFGGVCVANSCDAQQGTGFGESVVRDLIMTEAYMQQPFYTGMDLRIREILQGGKNGTGPIEATTNVDDLDAYGFTRYYIQHSIPRLNNPSGTFDNDQYMLEIITGGKNEAFENFVITWLENAGNYDYNPSGLLTDQTIALKNTPYVGCYIDCNSISPNFD
jgi:hypothetical protein